MEKDRFLYENVYYDLKTKIMDGSLKPEMQLPSEKEMVQSYQVSAITVKKALSLLVDEGLVKRIRGKGSFISGEHGPDSSVLKAEETSEKTEHRQDSRKIIGVIFEHVSSSYGLQMLYAMEEQTRKAGYHLYPCFSYGKRELETEEICYLRKIGACGLLIMPAHGVHYNTEILKLVIENFPVVLIDKKMDGIPLDSVRSDGEQSMKQLVSYLAEKGKKNISLITVEELDTSSLIERKKGFYAGMEENHLIPQNECTLPFMNYEDSFTVYGEIYRKKIRDYLQKEGQNLDGIICSEYGVAMQVLPVLEEENLSEQIEVCSIDENYIGPYQYQMTHVKQDEQKIAECAMGILLKKLQGVRTEQKDYLIPGNFIKGIRN